MSPSRIRLRLEALLAAMEAGTLPPQEALPAILTEQIKLDQRLEKISRISDGYQSQLQDLNHQLREANRSLTQALAEVKTLRGFIPICAKCKRVRDDQGYWNQVESYIAQRSEAIFSHGVCPDCARDLYGEMLVGMQISPERSRDGGERRRHARREDTDWLIHLEELVKKPEYEGHPLRDELLALAERHQRLLSRFDKIARISDGFQGQLKSLNQALAEASQTDPLTGLPNRRSMMERMKSELSRAERLKEPLTLIMADVDHFKGINDTFGHEVGDLVLQALSGAFRETLREYDTCARWGGEEFLLLLPRTDAAGGMAVARKLRELLSEDALVHEGQTLNPTLSMGIAVHQAGENLHSLLRRSDAALYAAKAQGRDRAVVSDQAPADG